MKGTEILYHIEEHYHLVIIPDFQTTQEDLQAVFGDIGPFTEIVLPKCKDKRFPNSCAGFAFIQFRKRQDAVKAIEELNMSEVD